MEDQHKGQHVRKDDEDVEGHVHKNAPDMHKAQNDDDKDEDDVEGHMHKNAVNKGMHKA